MRNMKKFEVIETKQCARCGAEFGVTCRQLRKKYCDECKPDVYKEIKKAYVESNRELIKQKAKKYRKPKPKRIIRCVRCGKDFKLWRGMSSVCIDCLMNGDSQDRRLAYLRNVIE